MTHPPIPPRPAVFLDFDGTLVDIAATPDAIIVSSDLVALLGRVRSRAEGALAVVTGRRIEEIDHHLSPLILPTAGLHGIERRRDGGAAIVELPKSRQVHILRDRLERSHLLENGVSLEDKGSGIAVHYRQAPEAAEAVKAALREAAGDLEELHLIEGKMVVEAKRRDVNKGIAIGEFMELPPFVGRTPVFLGDDVTDEDGFRIVTALGGIAIKVGDGATGAPFRLDDSTRVMEWLDRLARSQGSLAS
jgi:trehalose 6-phosphate phosphatase